MHLSQLKSGGVICRKGDSARLVNGADRLYDLAHEAIAVGRDLAALIDQHGLGVDVDLVALAAKGALDVPLRHPDPAHMFLTGTGLTHGHTGAVRAAAPEGPHDVTAAMKMFDTGLAGGKPQADEAGAQPAWFYKGNGVAAVAPGAALVSPAFALDAGEEPEIAGFYLIGPDGTPFRVGFALANEFSDHVTERLNDLLLAHSKLRPASFGPELVVGELPASIPGTSRIRRRNAVIWEKPFVTGEAAMSHSIRNLEYHHFKYLMFRQPGDLHVHMLGAAILSFSDAIRPEEGDIFEIEAPAFGQPLINPLVLAPPHRDSMAVL